MDIQSGEQFLLTGDKPTSALAWDAAVRLADHILVMVMLKE